VKKYSKKGLEKRKAEREGLGDFFLKHVQIIKDGRLCCQECGAKLIGDVSEVAHRLPKSFYKSLMTDDDNVLYLCSWKSSNNCHSMYDGSNEQLQSLQIFSREKELIKQLIEKATEKTNYKLYERWLIE
jgi:5-methylcytosine-specific restriction endonuclease McrA